MISPDVRVLSVPGELIADREVDAAEQDRLGHRQLAQQLGDLVENVPDRSNIALYGPWGSGKSGIGNLLRADVEKRKGLGFARFDAFKYAENPLRRNFISAVATELKVKDPKFHRDLYTGKTTTTFNVPVSSAVRLGLMFAGLLLGIFAVLVGIAAIAAAAQAGPFMEDFRPGVKQAVLASFTPAALLSALVVLAGKALGVERKTDKAESGEQFEDLFKELIKKAGKNRVVVFVDELDRCAPGDVVATLDAVRTFLGNAGCVFVIAADRQAIEEALTKKLKQATPADPVNPYYSSGSAYLDKVFQYQELVPPLLQASVTQYALELVDGLPGVWADLGDRLALTVSILVPSHIRSPRRVKNLLNAFALSYRLAEARQKDGRLHGDMLARSDEIARMTCLRIEFPLFARDLVLDAQLPKYVLRLFKGEPEADVWHDHPHATEQVRELARGFAGLNIPVATMLSEQPPEDDDDAEHDDGDSDDAGKVEHGFEQAGKEGDQDVGRQHGRQLLDYLSRTRSVDGPGRDLLFMQSTGSAVGLDGQLAERLEEDAANGSLQSLLTAVRALDDAERDAVVTLFIGQSGSAVGLEAQNVALSLLAIAALPGVDVAGRADALADALAPAVNDVPSLVEDGGLHGAWALGLHSERPTAQKLRQLVLGHANAYPDDQDVAMLVLGDSNSALAADAEATASVLVTHLLSNDADDAASTAQVLLALPPEQCARLIRASHSALSARLRAELAPPPAPPEPAAASRAGAAGAPPPAATGTNAEPELPGHLSGTLGTLLDGLNRAGGGPADVLTAALLGANRRSLRNLVEEHLPAAGTVNEPVLASALITACSIRSLDRWPEWLRTVGPEVSTSAELNNALLRLVKQLWSLTVDAAAVPAADAVRAAAVAVVDILDRRPVEERPSMSEDVQKSLGEPVEDDDAATERRRLITAAEPLLRCGALAPGVLAGKEAADLAATLRADLTVEEDDPVVAYVVASAEDTLRGFARPGVDGELPAPEAMSALVQTLHENTWLPEPHATLLRLVGRVAAPETAELPAAPTSQQINALRDEHGKSFDQAVAAWITATAPDVPELLAATDVALRADSPAVDLVDAVASRAAELPTKARVALLRGLLDDADRPPPSTQVLRAAGVGSVSDIEVARILTDRQTRANNGPQRKHLMAAWENAAVESDGSRRLLFEKILIPLFKPKDSGGSQAAIDLGIEYLPRLAKKQPTKTKTPLGNAVVRAVGEERAGKILGPLGYKVTESGSLFWRRTKIDTS